MNAKSNEMTDRAMEFTKVVTERWDDRLTGSPACAACGDHIYEKLGEFCDQTEYQDFTVRPGSFLGFIRINVVLFFVALVALWVDWLLVSAIVTAVAIVILVLQFFFYWELIDFLFPKRNARNVWGTIEPSGRVEQQIYVTAHHDSAHVFHFLQSNAKWYSLRIFVGMGVLVAMTTTCWLLWLGNAVGIQMDPIRMVACWSFTLVSPAVLMLWFFYSDQGTPGAGDDMICTSVSLEIGKYFAERRESNEGLRHTRVVIGSWDAEEAGLRGARAFVKQHRRRLSEVETYNLNLECLYDHNELCFLTSDLNSFVQLSASMAEQCSRIAKDLGYEAKPTSFPLLAGGTDAAEFAKAGAQATTLSAINWTDKGELPAYHTTRDTIDAVDPEAVRRSIEIGIRYIEYQDEQIGRQ